MKKRKQIWFSRKKFGDWWEMYFYPLEFEEIYPLLQEFIEGEQIVLYEFNSLANDDGTKAVKKLGVEPVELCMKQESPAICTFPKAELKKFTEIPQYDLDWVDFKTKPDPKTLSKVDIRVFDNKLPKYTELFEKSGTSLLFSSHDNESAYFCTRDPNAALKFLKYLVPVFLREHVPEFAVTQIGDDLLTQLIERSDEGIIIDHHDLRHEDAKLNLICWQDSDGKEIEAFDISVSGEKVDLSEWETRERPKYLKRPGCLPFIIGLIVLAAAVVAVVKFFA